YTASHLLHSLFLQRSPHHPDLHSFPTRRSSDRRVSRDGNRRRRGACGAPAAESGERIPSQGAFTRAAHVRSGGPAAAARRSLRGDRKSTRLNSSHSQISYAVFCLKKKKIDESVR